MKTRIFYLLIAWVLCLNYAKADNLIVPNITVPQGGTASLVIGYSFTSSTDKVGFTFKLNMPDGISLVNDEYGDPVYTKDETSIAKLNIQCPGEGNFAGQPSNATATIKGTEGTLLTLTLAADNSLAVGSTHTVNVTNCTFQQRVEGVTTDINIDAFSFIVTIGEPADSRAILDETSTSAPEAATGVDVRVKRTIRANEWSTICLPFAMDATQVKSAFGDDVALGDFTGYTPTYDGSDNVTAITVNFNKVTAMEANHPYIIKVSSAITEFTVDGVTIDPQEAKVSFGTTTGSGKNKVYHPVDFIGTYVADFDFYNDATSYPLFLNANKFYYATENTKHMKAFRAYFDFDDYMPEAEPASAPIYMSFENETTGIRNINMAGESDSYYDLQGRRVETPSKGLYIKNGKKVVIK